MAGSISRMYTLYDVDRHVALGGLLSSIVIQIHNIRGDSPEFRVASRQGSRQGKLSRVSSSIEIRGSSIWRSPCISLYLVALLTDILLRELSGGCEFEYDDQR